jgi:glycosyltransferase involved in cell wall biosynthesis
VYSTNKTIRALHVVNTADGALCAARQAEVLAGLGVEVHVALPAACGALVPFWYEVAARVHLVNLDLPAKRPWEVPRLFAAARQLVDKVRPDIIHSHSAGTTLSLRLALDRTHAVPRVFQVPRPLHLEHLAPRIAEIQSASWRDYWIGSSACIVRHYLDAGVDPARVFLSYYGTPIRTVARTGYLRRRLGIDDDTKIVGNINLIYPPKRFLGQRVGLKCHEDIIDALGLIVRERDDVVGVLIGSTFGTSDLRYERELRRRAENTGRGKILMPGYFGAAEVQESWPDFDCAVHVPVSENCGGVVEPLMAGVPAVAGRVGGLPEVVIEGVTGTSVPVHDPWAIASAVLNILNDPEPHRRIAAAGQRLVRSMFDVERTAREVAQIYRHILHGAPRPAEFYAGSVLNAPLADDFDLRVF